MRRRLHSKDLLPQNLLPKNLLPKNLPPQNVLPLTFALFSLLLMASLPAGAQMSETYRADRESKTAEGVMEIYFCESEGGFSFSLYDKRVNPQQRLLHKYEVKGLSPESGKLKRAKKDRTACEGAPESSITSEPIAVEPIPVPEENDFIWVLQLRFEGNQSMPVVVSREGLPFRAVIEYHEETKGFRVQS